MTDGRIKTLTLPVWESQHLWIKGILCRYRHAGSDLGRPRGSRHVLRRRRCSWKMEDLQPGTEK